LRAEAVALVEASGGNIAGVAEELGVCDSTLGNWVRRFREQADGAPSVGERAEIRELRGELDRVTRVRDVLAKAVRGRGASTGFMKSCGPLVDVGTDWRWNARQKHDAGACREPLIVALSTHLRLV
jgi:Transposase